MVLKLKWNKRLPGVTDCSLVYGPCRPFVHHRHAGLVSLPPYGASSLRTVPALKGTSLAKELHKEPHQKFAPIIWAQNLP